MQYVPERGLCGVWGPGVCQVQDIVERKFDGLDKAHLYYVLAPVYQDGVLYVPADNPRIFLRAVISAEEANRLIDQIPTMEGKAFHSRSSQELSAHYEEAMRTHSCADLIRLTMSIHTKKRDLASQKKKFGRVDEHFMKRAEDSLNGEFAIALGHPPGGSAGVYFPADRRPRPRQKLTQRKSPPLRRAFVIGSHSSWGPPYQISAAPARLTAPGMM